ncbi:hypothetical protein GRI89_15520 [Altererythrobacter salegens]|uniref:Uncharacterized protein n=1 Tax=Croceibacterium salegens TaxID=1737568 RepID=A0A6I4T2S5_9SPHN|nr:hypothetical protein [Croceibacterium salegens]MXO60952.1 hypothetical protein [Croceibacterium salegens]
MSIRRYLAFFCFGLGLLVQVAAHAAAVPVIESSQTMDCDEMQHSKISGPVSEGMSGESREPCKEMTLGCLVAMNCVSPLFATDDTSGGFKPYIDRQSFLAPIANTLHGQPLAPEAPPPRL